MSIVYIRNYKNIRNFIERRKQQTRKWNDLKYKFKKKGIKSCIYTSENTE